MQHARSLRKARLLCLSLVLLAWPPDHSTEAYAWRWQQQQQSRSHTHEPNAPPAASASYARTIVGYEPPDVPLVGMDGRKTSLSTVLGHDGPIMLQFIFTTCPTICPVMSSTFSSAQQKLGEDVGKFRMISISVDPEHDTPERLREYAHKFRAGSQWLFLTGSTEDIAAVQKAFDAYRGSKMRHEPLTFLRGAAGELWLRLDGLMSATQLVAELRVLAPK